jgi:hypothetical protein
MGPQSAGPDSVHHNAFMIKFFFVSDGVRYDVNIMVPGGE